MSSATASAYGLLTIDLDAIAENYRRLAARAGGCEVAAVVKADAYGLGMAQVAPALAAAGARCFFVAQLDEALALRSLLEGVAPKASIYVLNGVLNGAKSEYPAKDIRPVLNSLEDVAVWRDLARHRGEALPAALHVDTGMNRLGFAARDVEALAGNSRLLDGISLSLVMSHLACAEEQSNALNREQLNRFETARRRLPPAPASLANSSGLFLGPAFHFDLARPGAALYGINPTPKDLNPMVQVVRLQGRILQVREIDAPQTVGYGATHSVTGPARIATVAVGYADGYLRSLSNRATAWVGEQQVPAVGRVSMDLITLDVTDVQEPKTAAGSFVDLLAPENGIDTLAGRAGTIGYEILTALGQRYHRIYRGGIH